MLDKGIPHIGVLMVKRDMGCYPRFALPSGYTLRNATPEDQGEWAALQFALGQTESLQEATELFEREFMRDQALQSRQQWVAIDAEGKLVGTAALWPGMHFGQEWQRVHWVAVAEAHQGRGLAKALFTHVLDAYCTSGYQQDFLYLTTQTWSYRAIHLYQQFGFEAYRGERPVRWRNETSFEEENARAWALIESKIQESRPR